MYRTRALSLTKIIKTRKNKGKQRRKIRLISQADRFKFRCVPTPAQITNIKKRTIRVYEKNPRNERYYTLYVTG